MPSLKELQDAKKRADEAKLALTKMDQNAARIIESLLLEVARELDCGDKLHLDTCKGGSLSLKPISEHAALNRNGNYTFSIKIDNEDRLIPISGELRPCRVQHPMNKRKLVQGWELLCNSKTIGILDGDIPADTSIKEYAKQFTILIGKAI